MKKWVYIFKGIIFIAIGMCFFSVKFYEIQSVVFLQELNNDVFAYIPNHFASYFNEFFKQSGMNVLFSVLFIALGIIELISSKGVARNANN